jgi:hypothetical protein
VVDEPDDGASHPLLVADAAATDVRGLVSVLQADDAATEVSVGFTAVETTKDGPVYPPKGPEG